MEYNFKEIESRWQQRWRENKTYRVETDPSRPKFYVLDMFPYPSGAGLHVGHPLGYIASDIYSRYKRLKGFNVLHPMGYDAFGLPAEQYAIQTGQHPAVTTERNIARYREQLDKIGFSFDWDREVRTCDPKYYKWTQWAFLKMFASYYCNDRQQARPIEELKAAFAASGTEGLNVACTTEMRFTAAEWNAWDEVRREQVLQNYRLAYRADTMVNWCPKLGTVLANDEVRDGLSVRGGYPVEQKRMKQWLLRVTAYAQRMLDGLEGLEWSDSLKEIQRNWIGRSVGAQVFFDIQGSDRKLEIFTTRPDTIFGVTFMVIAPEHEWVGELTTPENRDAVERYIAEARKRSERERIAETRRVSGVATGSCAVNPFTGKAIPIYVSDYVLAGYGTGGHHGRPGARLARLGLRAPLRTGGDPGGRRRRRREGVLRRQGRPDDQLGIPRRQGGQGGHRADVRRGGAARSGQTPGQLPAARRHLLAPALLGRAVPDLLQGRRGPSARGRRAAARVAPDRGFRTHGRGRTAAGPREGVAHPRRVSLRALDDARVRRLVGLLPALHGPAQRRGARRQGGRRILAQRRSLRRRHRARHGPPHVFAFLEHVPLRPGIRLRAGTVPQTRQSGHDPGPFELRLSRRGDQQVRIVRASRSNTRRRRSTWT